MPLVKLFIGGFPLDMDEMQLAQLVSPHGNIQTLKIVRDKKTRICKGYAFIEMNSEEDAVNVMAALDGEQISDRQLSVRLAAEPVVQSVYSASQKEKAAPLIVIP